MSYSSSPSPGTPLKAMALARKFTATASTHNTSLSSKDNVQSITKLTKNQINLSFMAGARLRNHFHSLPYINLNASFIMILILSVQLITYRNTAKILYGYVSHSSCQVRILLVVKRFAHHLWRDTQQCGYFLAYTMLYDYSFLHIFLC